MNKIKYLLIAVLFFSVVKTYAITDFEANTIILKIKPNYREFCKPNSIEIGVLQNIFSGINVTNIRKIYPTHVTPSPSEKARNRNLVDLTLVYEVKYASNVSVLKTIAGLQKLSCVAYAEPHYNYALTYTPNDTDIALQFYHNNLKTFAAYNISMGDTGTVIGITDTGFDTSHIDLKNSYKKNYADPINGMDDDNDGFIDNFVGWDFGNNDNNPVPDPCAICNHGVHVAGICSATADNITGIAGTGFKCKFMAIKIMNSAGQLVNGYEGIVYAADHNCKVVNCSWGGGSGGQYGQDAINYATYNKNCLVVAAAGNYSSSSLFYPAAFDNVLCIAATDSDDVKWSNSNFGIYVDACAPGKDIVSTWPGNVYVPSSGTSMASPAAAGCAAIVASYFPNYNPLQIAERVKNTCDNIDTVGSNTLFANQLGHGRINLYRALTDVEISALVTTTKNITDSNDNAIVSGDTVRLKCTFTNYLAATTNLAVKLRSNSNYVAIIDSVVTLGAIATMGDTSNFNHPFKIIVNANCPQNFDVLFSIVFEDGAYIRNEYFYLRANVDYINLLENDLGITITSKGLIGYNTSGAIDGIGVTYNGNGSMIYEGGLMIGNSPTQVSDFVRGAAGAHDTDFVSFANVSVVIPSVTADADLTGNFNDDGAGSSKLDIDVHHQTYAWSSTGNTNFVILKYIIKNKSNTPITALHAGIFADWDIMNFNKNRTRLNSNLKMSYAYSTENNSLYAGVKVLSASGFSHYALDNVSGGAGGVNISDSYNAFEKYITLSTNRDSAGFTSAQGNDIVDVVSTGPITIGALDSAEVSFAIIAGSQEQELIDGANAAQIKYNGIITDTFPYRGKNDFAIYPNPCSSCTVFLNNYVAEKTSISIANLAGEVVLTKPLNSINERIHLSALAQGIYIVSVNVSGNSSYSKLVVKHE